MTLNVRGLSHIGPRVTDLARAKAFYMETLGQDAVANAPYISFYDPDGIAWEFYVFTMEQS